MSIQVDEQLSDHLMRLLFLVLLCVGGYFFQQDNKRGREQREEVVPAEEYAWCQQACNIVALPVVIASEDNCVCGGTGIVREVQIDE